jgi:hypothetical protein
VSVNARANDGATRPAPIHPTSSNEQQKPGLYRLSGQQGDATTCAGAGGGAGGSWLLGWAAHQIRCCAAGQREGRPRFRAAWLLARVRMAGEGPMALGTGAMGSFLIGSWRGHERSRKMGPTVFLGSGRAVGPINRRRRPRCRFLKQQRHWCAVEGFSSEPCCHAMR